VDEVLEVTATDELLVAETLEAADEADDEDAGPAV
jgi:hypothetical protein